MPFGYSRGPLRSHAGYHGRGSYSFGRSLRKLTGINHYKKRLTRVPKAVALGAAMGAMGGPRGMATGGVMGGLRAFRGHGFNGNKKTKGRGMYQGRGLYQGRGGYNSLIHGGPSAMSGTFTGDEQGTVIYSHREYVRDIYGPTTPAFTNELIPINPGLRQSMPWLSQAASNYTEYELIQCVYEYKSLVEANNTDSGLNGEIIMATNYNVGNHKFCDKATMLQYHGAQSGKPTMDHAHGIECDPKKNPGDGHKYIRSSPTKVGEDLKSYDHANFQVAINNCPSQFLNKQLGELWIVYKVKLMKPRLFVSRGMFQQYDTYVASTGLVGVGGGVRKLWGPSTATPYFVPTNLLVGQQNTINVSITQPVEIPAWPATSPPTTYTTPNNSFLVTFPAWYEGLVELKLRVKGVGLSRAGDGLFSGDSKATIKVAGQVNQVYDIYAADLATPNSTTTMYNSTISSGTLAYTTTSEAYCEVVLHVNVKAATAGLDNTVLFGLAEQTFLAVAQTNLVVKEYSAMQLGECPSADARNTYLNSSGVETVP